MQITIKTPYSLHETGQEHQNEDAVFPVVGQATDKQRLFIICDGDGKLRNGDVAAQLVCDGFRDYFTKVNPPKEAVGQLYANEALRYVESKMRKFHQQNPRKAKGIQSTIALLHINDNDTISIAWLGDCRVYHIRNGQLLYKTEDHIASVWEGGQRRLAAQTISPIDPAWISVATIKEPLSNDLFFICSKGVSTVLEDRNIKYLLSQSDGTDATHQAIIQKINDLCAGNTSYNYSAHFIPIASSPHIAVLPTQKKGKQSKAAGGKLNLDIHSKSTTSKKRKTSLPRPSFSNFPARKGALALLFLVAATLAIALGYKYLHSSPTDLFNNQIKLANTHIQNADYDQAIDVIHQALQIEIPDSLAILDAQQLLTKAEEGQIIQQANTAYSKGNLFKAKETYQAALTAYPNRPMVKAKMDEVMAEIETKKQPLLQQADTLLQQKEYEEAKAALYEALYLDQRNDTILQLINQCNLELKQDSVSLPIALQEAISARKIKSEPTNSEIATVDSIEEQVTNAVVDSLPIPPTTDVAGGELLADEQVKTPSPVERQASRQNTVDNTSSPQTTTTNRYNDPIIRSTPPSRPTTTPSNPTKPWNNPAVIPKYRQPIASSEQPKPSPPPKTKVEQPSSSDGWWSSKRKKEKEEQQKSQNSSWGKKKNTDTNTEATASTTNTAPKTEEKPKPPEPTPPPKVESEKPKPPKASPADNIEKAAKQAFNAGNYTLAKQKYEELLRYKNTDEVINQIATCEQKLNERTYTRLIKEADRAFQQKNYETAKSTYQKAIKYQSGDDYARRQMEKTSQLIAEQLSQFAQFKAAGDRAFDSGDYAAARQNYQSALPYAKDKKRIQAKIEECNQRMANLSQASSKKTVKKAERHCKSKGYNGECYDYLKSNDAFYSVEAKTLYRLGEYFESKNKAKAKECYAAAASKGSDAARKKLKDL